MIEAGIGALFMPYGLGRLLGLGFHDAWATSWVLMSMMWVAITAEGLPKTPITNPNSHPQTYPHSPTPILTPTTTLGHLLGLGFHDVVRYPPGQPPRDPPGLGHLLGLDVHDVGGYPPGGAARDPRPGFNKLRTARILEVGMVVTVEPGCYFNPALLLPALEDPAQSRFFVKDVVVSVLNLGGVRMEDNLVVTEDGSESLTHVPRSIPDVERVMAGGRWVVP
eukprot:gene3377-13413_t